MMNKKFGAKIIFLGIFSFSPLASAASLSDAFSRGYQSSIDMSNYEANKRAQAEMYQQQVEQQRLETQRRQDEYDRQKKERDDLQRKQDRQQSLEARLDEMQKKMADQDAIQKQLTESQAREEALRVEIEALKASKTTKSKKKKKSADPVK
jgi:hypothetical protein